MTMNKRIALILIMAFSLQYGLAQTEKATDKKTIDSLAVFTNATYDMGTIVTGKNVEFIVTVKNISVVDTLEIADVKVSCGCTTPKYRSHELILPGKTALVTLGFNGSARGEFTKQAEIVFKGGYSKQIQFRGVAVAE